MIRTVSGHGELTSMVGRLSWKLDGKEYGVEVECGEEEEDLLEALEECLREMLNSIL